MSQNEKDAFRRKVMDKWTKPPGWPDNLKFVFRILIKRDGNLAAAPALVRGTNINHALILAESAQHALLQAQPYTMLRPEHYEDWKDMEVVFDPTNPF
jgi:colicin import membrane protein